MKAALAALLAALACAALPARAAEDPELLRLYRAAGRDALWLDPAQQPNADAREALSLLADAAADGLDPADYRPAEPAAAASPRAWDRSLSQALLRYLHDLHAGRVDARRLGFRIDVRDDVDIAARLAAALPAHRLRETAAALAPALPQYRSLRATLKRYRALTAEGDVDLAASGAAVRVGQRLAGAGALRRRLQALGDLDAAAPPDDTPLYDAGSSEAVRRFQARHGLAADGVLGTATRAALRVPLAHRVRQIELAMERLRWLPRLNDRRFIAINIPMFRLWAVDPGAADGASPLAMDVVVGRALLTPTPVLMREMREVIFRPYWNVPRSILRHEVLPAIARDPGYLQRENMEIVRGEGDDAQPVAASAQNLALLAQGALRVRQRPGPRNSLGLVKFVFPNDDDVYMHGTPATQLFDRARRDFSHGCVRLEDPVALALWVLRNERPAWPRERIEASMTAPRSQRVRLAQPIPVLLFYVTAVVMHDGTIHFADDIYGHDARLEHALAAAR